MVKRIFCLVLLLFSLTFYSCSMESVIPETGQIYSHYFENQKLFSDTVSELVGIGHDAFISKTEYYSIENTDGIIDYYIQNMSDSACEAYDNEIVEKVFDICNVKLIDVIYRGDLTVCTFDMCIPGKNYDYGIYYVTNDSPIYFGDPTVSLTESGKGFTYEQSASYGTKFTYYTEKLADNYYYYEIM